MQMLLRMAWRNLYRNTRRTAITGIAIAVGLAALLLSLALFEGVNRQMTARLTEDFLGDGQIHAAGYRRTRDVARTLPGGEKLLQRLRRDKRVRSVAPRVIAFGLISSAEDALGVRILGVEPAAEKEAFRFYRKICRGAFFPGRREREVVLGARAARTLGIRIGSRLVLTVAQPGSGELAQQLFRLAGTFRTGARELDNGLALVRLGDLQAMLGMTGQLHEIALRLEPQVEAEPRARDAFWSGLAHSGIEALPWTELAPQFHAIQRLQWVSFAILVGIVFAIIALGIMNTLLMSLFERTREFGVLRALGTRPAWLGCLVLFEAASLAVFAALPGLVLGLGVSAWFQVHGVDWSGMSYGGVYFTEPTRARITSGGVALSLAVIVLTTVLVAVFPALKAMRIRPVDALRRRH
ncbi:MAG: ABC transporter permease [Kiritimatiellaeota bacterium]|nr:ABC transporter permease [Kiritimatiellota bacterium]